MLAPLTRLSVLEAQSSSAAAAASNSAGDEALAALDAGRPEQAAAALRRALFADPG